MRRLIPRWRLSTWLVALAIALLGPATTTRAGVEVGPEHIVLTGPGGGRAIIDRAPFRLRVLNAAGRTVLAEIAPGAGPLRLRPATQLEYGALTTAPPTLYAPLGFLVGHLRLGQVPGGQWEGVLTSIGEVGEEYSAHAVLSARAAGAGVRLTLSTDDPSGRTLTLSVSPAGTPNAFRISVRPVPAHGVAAMTDSFVSPPAEAFHGFGGRHDSLDQRGRTFVNWIEQENVASGSPTGLTTPAVRGSYLFPNGPESAYDVQSSFVSSAGYSYLLDRSEISRWRLDSDRRGAWQVEVGARGLDEVIAAGSPTQAMASLSALTGRQPVPPVWAMGSILDRLVRFPAESPAQYASEVESDIAHIDRDHLHVDAYRLEGWAALPGPVLRHIIAQLRARGIHPLLYFRAFVGLDRGTDSPAAYAYAIAHHLVATRADGRPYIFTDNFGQPAAVIDFTNPAAVRWWQRRVTAALDLGADGFMQDFGEQVLAGMHFRDGASGLTMHNRLPILYDRATRQVLDAFIQAHPRRQLFFFTRAGYSGTPGDAAHENANFPGDETTDWSRASGLASLTTDMLNRAIAGDFGYTTDIGGYFDAGPYPPTTRELFLRWAEWAALTPFFRLHGSVLAGTHMPWDYGPWALSVYRRLIALHLRARALIARLWRTADASGVPITRPLWLADPGDPAAAGQDQEWLLGRDVLVAPVVTQGARSRRVFFPPGCWARPGTALRVHGPRSRSVAAGLAQLPYFFRCGTSPFAPSAH